MAKFEDFKVGESVAHINIGDGHVSAIEDGHVCVTYDRKDAREKPFTGKYDHRWFELHPAYLFHRHIQPV